MCSETFLRLPEEKRNRFLEAAWEEFTAKPFIDVSINKIVFKPGFREGVFINIFQIKKSCFLTS